jgi:hypothetical protein
MTKKEAVEQIFRECFWGDYRISADEILHRLEAGDATFARFLFGKIADNARYLSRLIRILFSPREIEAVLADVTSRPRWQDRRHRCIRANLTGDRKLVPELMWRR